ncbi:hypothetical protein [uncultured Streptomyces sp.]|uniref:hypothetical protein n=1 Tax=uncultured Streptomyces sp. TaxID=174707 RepID=UPI00261D0FCC|nr:hypothetical protein [uncultured Streptomyces sp.]
MELNDTRSELPEEQSESPVPTAASGTRTAPDATPEPGPHDGPAPTAPLAGTAPVAPTGAPAVSVAPDEASTVPEHGTTPPERTRPRGRTTLIVLAAALLGVSAGAAVGFGVQAGREPTPLPVLAQHGLGYPAKSLPADQAPDPLPAEQDHLRTTDGNLLKLLVDRPKGARDVDGLPAERWVGLSEYAKEFEEPDSMFTSLADMDFRRNAAAVWLQGEYRTTFVNLVQFRPGSRAGATEFFEEQNAYMPYEEGGAGNDGFPIDGSGSGRYYLSPVERKAGYEPMYEARALARRGDIVMDIHVFDNKPIKKKSVEALAEKQWERL